jgi:hypothetical protein
MYGEIIECIRLNEPVRISRLRLNVYARHVESSAAISFTGTTGTAKEVQQSRSPRVH